MKGLRIVLPTSTSANIPSPQFQAATLANLQLVNPGSVPFYQKIFALYNGAAGAARATNSLTDGGCGSAAFEQTIGGPCALQFQATPGNFTGEWLVSWRIDQISQPQGSGVPAHLYRPWRASYQYRRDQSGFQCDQPAA